MAFSNLRFGYQETEDGDIIPEPTEQAILQEIKRLTVLGRSSAQIAAELNNQGYRTRIRRNGSENNESPLGD